MNKIKKLVCMLLVVCFSVAAFPFTFASASSGQIAIQEASTGRYLHAQNNPGNDLEFKEGEFWFDEMSTDTNGEFRLYFDGGIDGFYVQAFDTWFDDGLESNPARPGKNNSSDFQLESAGDGTYYLKSLGNTAGHRSAYLESFDDGDIDLTKHKDEAVKVNVYRK